MSAFPELSEGQDSAKYGVEQEDPTIRYEMDGGYQIARRRFTRAPRRTWKFGFSFIPNSDKALIESHFSGNVGAVIFDWTNDQDNNTYQVRYTKAPIYKYVGRGELQRWDVDIEVQEA